MTSTIFGTPTNTFNSFHFSPANQFNQEACASVLITGPGRVTDLNVFWDGDGEVVSGNNVMWDAGNTIELFSSPYSSNTGSEATGGQSLHTTTHNYFFPTTRNVNVGFWRDKTKSSVASVATGGADGMAKTSTNPGAIDTMAGSSSFTAVYGTLGKGSIRAYGHYMPSNVYVRRSNVWVPVQSDVRRGVTNTPVTVSVRRSNTWTPLNMIPSNEWDDPIEKEALVFIADTWELGIIRDEEPVLFGVAV